MLIDSSTACPRLLCTIPQYTIRVSYQRYVIFFLYFLSLSFFLSFFLFLFSLSGAAWFATRNGRELGLRDVHHDGFHYWTSWVRDLLFNY